MRPLLRRLAGFGGLPLISMITPLLVLPVIARVAGPAGWASLVAGEAVGTLGGIVVGYGWNTSGPPRIAALGGAGERVAVYRESLRVRGALTVVVAPVVVGLCVLVARPGFVLPTVLMGLAGGVPALTFAWYCVGVGDPRPIAVYEAVPRVVAAALAAGLVLATRQLVLYPLLAVGVSVAGLLLFGRTLPRDEPGQRPRPGLRALLARDRHLAGVDVATGAYGALPVPLANGMLLAAAAAAYASADKLYRFGQFVPITLANGFQSWTVEAGPAATARRTRAAIGAHAAIGLVGWAVFALLGPWVSALMFGAQVAADRWVCVLLGAAFACLSVRTSLVRHALVPAGRVRVVLAATVLGAVLGTVVMLLATPAAGAPGTAVGVLVSEATIAGALVGPALRHLRRGSS